MPAKRVSVVGLGKLGLCLAAVLAERGFSVTGLDVDQKKIDAVNEGRSPIYEPGLEQLISSNHARLKATSEYSEAIPSSFATFVVVPTPSDKTGGFSLQYVTAAMEGIGRALAKKDSYHLVVLTSTVMPGSMDGSVRPSLEHSSGKECGKDFGLCYNPEFIALGNVINGLLKPDFILIGESDLRAGRTLARIQALICTNYPPIERLNFVGAELAKISVNSFVTMKMSFANTLAEMCEKLPGADVDGVTTAIGRDKRIGPAYLKGALGYGGPCFPRDNVAFARLAESLGAQAKLAAATHEVNLRQVERIVKKVMSIVPGKRSTVAILGLAYKPDTNIVDESQSVMLARRLSTEGLRVRVYDPAALENAELSLGDSVIYDGSAEQCIAGSEVCVLATPWNEFRELSPSVFKGKIVLDCWRVLDQKSMKTRKYISIGTA